MNIQMTGSGSGRARLRPSRPCNRGRRGGASTGARFGGDTDINKAVACCEQFVTDPGQTIFFLISDLIEGENQAQMIRRMHEMVAACVRVICLLALSDSGIPMFDERAAKRLAGGGVPCFGCTPNRLPELIEGVLKKHALKALAARLAAGRK